MPIISSHVLDSVKGDHAAGIRVECYALSDGVRQHKVFDVQGNHEGRIAEEVSTDEHNGETRLELIFHSSDYFATVHGRSSDNATVPEVVVHVSISTDKPKVHVPIMLSPHSYSIWWSS